tara:strand:+ start:4666 stop:4902 length:237 start_codon:yes stop_codon:yes gene_type:complete
MKYLVLIMLLLVGCETLTDISDTLFYRGEGSSSTAEDAVQVARPLIPTPWSEAAVAVVTAVATWWTAKRKLSSPPEKK